MKYLHVEKYNYFPMFKAILGWSLLW